MEVAKLKDLDRDEYKMYMKMALEDPRHVKAYMIKLIIDADAAWEEETTRNRFYGRATTIIQTCDAEFRHRAIAHAGKEMR